MFSKYLEKYFLVNSAILNFNKRFGLKMKFQQYLVLYFIENIKLYNAVIELGLYLAIF